MHVRDPICTCKIPSAHKIPDRKQKWSIEYIFIQSHDHSRNCNSGINICNKYFAMSWVQVLSLLSSVYYESIHGGRRPTTNSWYSELAPARSNPIAIRRLELLKFPIGRCRRRVYKLQFGSRFRVARLALQFAGVEVFSSPSKYSQST